MKKISLSVFVLGLIVSAVQPYRLGTVEPGEVALRIKLFGSEETRGIENADIVTGGRFLVNTWGTDIIKFPQTQTEYQFTDKSDKYSPEAQALKFTIKGTEFRESVVTNIQFPQSGLREYYGTHKLAPSDFIQGVFYSGVNSCYTETVESSGVEPVEYLSQRGELAQKAKDCVQKLFPYVNVISLNVFDLPIYPASLADSITARNTALQEQQTAQAEEETARARAAANLATAQGENAVKVEKAKADAEVARLSSQAAQSAGYIRLRELEIQMERAKNWNGQEVAPTVINTTTAPVTTGTVSSK